VASATKICGAESFADDLVAAEQFHQQHGGGKDGETLEHADQRKPFEAVHAVGFRSSRSIHGGVSWSGPSPARTVTAAGKLAAPAKRGREADHVARQRSSDKETTQRNPGGQAQSPPPILPTIDGAARRANLSRVGMIDLEPKSPAISRPSRPA
jgi:hypothetical protein